MKYLLDTDIVSYLADKNSPFHEPVRDRLSEAGDDDQVCVSILTLYEIEFGVF